MSWVAFGNGWALYKWGARGNKSVLLASSFRVFENIYGRMGLMACFNSDILAEGHFTVQVIIQWFQCVSKGIFVFG